MFVYYEFFTQLCVWVGVLLSCGKHLNDRIISVRGEFWDNKTSVISPLCTDMHVPSQESEQWYVISNM